MDLVEYAPFKALEIDMVRVFELNGLSYLIVTLSNGFVLCFNLYVNALKSTNSQFTGDSVQIVRLSQVFKCGNIIESIS